MTFSPVTSSSRRWNEFASGAFSLIELLVAMGVLALMSVMMVSITSSAQNISRQTTNRVEQFREARRAFERLSARLSQATLNVYYDYVDSGGSPRASGDVNFTPARYARLSELRFLISNARGLSAPRGGELVGKAVFFNAPVGETTSVALSGMNSLINTVGYFVEKGSDADLRPPTLAAVPSRTRYRLFEMSEPSERLTIYSLTSGNPMTQSDQWFKAPLAVRNHSRPLAENIVGLVFEAIYRDGAGKMRRSFDYTSQPKAMPTQAIEENNLPSHVQVTMIAVDDASAQRIESSGIALTDAVDAGSLKQLEKELKEAKLGFRRFQSTVAIGPARWSAQ